MKRKIIYLILFLILMTPLFMWLAWFTTPQKKLVVAIIDKTVLTPAGQEHLSLNWVLNHHRFTKTSKERYKTSRDYFGFFPLEEKKYEIKGLERFSSSQLEQLSRDIDLVYFTDTYGIYNNEWYQEGDIRGKSGMIYGGLSDKDVELLRLMKNKKKLILTEFNTIGSPTKKENREAFENLFALKWTGWTGRYFDNLDVEVNQDIPQWLINNYKNSHNNSWPFKNAGVAFVNDDGEVVILEEGNHLENAMPLIVSSPKARKKLSLPEQVKYPFWFDVMKPDLTPNTIEASFTLRVNASGSAELKKYDIPATFPAVISHTGEDYRFYYFSGDFSDNPIGMESSYFKGIGFFKGFFYDDRQPLDRGSFFWNFYKPMLSRILTDYSESRDKPAKEF